MKILLSILLCLFLTVSKAQETKLLKAQIKNDLLFLRKTLNENSSYVYLNGYDFNSDFENYFDKIGDTTSIKDFSLFLTKTIGKIGDRHSSWTGYRYIDTLFLPFSYAPENDKVVVLNRNSKKDLAIMSKNFPYLKAVNGIAIQDFLHQILPSAIQAPKEAYFTNAVRELRDIQKNHYVINKPLPNNIELTLSNASFQKDTAIIVAPVSKNRRPGYWDEKFERTYFLLKDEDYNKPEIVKQLFNVNEGIGYIQIPSMVSKADAPYFFDTLNAFMQAVNANTEALIVDVRSNGGGTRELIYELAKYFIHPDSIYVVNVAQQRAPLPLSSDYIEALHDRNLFAFAELNKLEQQSVSKFLKTFKPQYNLDTKKYSKYYFGLLNGKKLTNASFYYNKPIYILANEKSFSAASVLVSVFKDIPNIKIAGTTTDGSSGNSERFELPNAKLRLKISTMVSFQKDGKILDGFGTAPDIKISRDMNQILWKADTQLDNLRSFIIKNRSH